MLIFDEARGRVVGSLGWADRAAIWVFDLRSRRTELIPVSDAKHVEVRRFGDVVRAVHYGGKTPTLSIRTLADLHRDAAELRVVDDKPMFSGDAVLWTSVDPCALLPTNRGSRLIHIDAARQSVQLLDLDWYTLGNYDPGYQGLIDCLTTPSREYAIVSVQRSSQLVVIDIRQNKKTREIALAGKSGNPLLTPFSNTEILANDYDTMCRVDLGSMSMVASQRVQGDSHKGVHQFIGDYSVDASGVLVARPYSGDAVLLDGSNFRLLGRAVTGGQPLQAVRLSNDAVLARDWQTGRPLEGSLGTGL